MSDLSLEQLTRQLQQAIDAEAYADATKLLNALRLQAGSEASAPALRALRSQLARLGEVLVLQQQERQVRLISVSGKSRRANAYRTTGRQSVPPTRDLR